MDLHVGDRLLIPCPACGKLRALPADLEVGVPFHLTPCGHLGCGATFYGVLRDGHIEELDYVSPKR